MLPCGAYRAAYSLLEQWGILFCVLLHQCLISTFVHRIMKTHGLQYLLGDTGTISRAAVKMNRRIFVSGDFTDAHGDFFIRNMCGTFNMACVKFIGGADIDPNFVGRSDAGHSEQ